MNELKADHFDCSCSSDEHTIVFRYFEDDEEKQFYLSVYLNQYRRLYQRILVGIKYIFGYKCKYGHWDCWDLHERDCDRMIELLEKFKSSGKEAL